MTFDQLKLNKILRGPPVLENKAGLQAGPEIDKQAEAGKMPTLQSETGKMPVLQSDAGKMPALRFKGFNKEAEIHKTHRNLPHWEQDGCTYFITFRMADSLPQEKLRAWQQEKMIWLKYHPKPWADKVIQEYEERFGRRLEEWLDSGYGSCALKNADIRILVENALRYFDGEHYALDAFVIMPNHVHALVQPKPGFELSEILHSWKSYTAKQINQRLNLDGAFWMEERFDHAVRNLSQLEHFRGYIIENPVKAGLKEDWFTLSCGTGILPALSKTGVSPVACRTGISPVPSRTGVSPVPSESADGMPPVEEVNRQDAYVTIKDHRQDACFTTRNHRHDACVTSADHRQDVWATDAWATEQFLIEQALNPMLAEVTAQRTRETETIAKHLEISLNELIHRQNIRLAELLEMQERGDTSQPLAANLKQTEDRIDELNARLEHRRAELQRERECMIGDIQHVAKAWVLPHPDRQSPAIAPMVNDPEIEKIAVQFAIKHEEAEGRVVESVESENRGFDLISRKPHPEDPKTAIEVRFIEVKGRADTGEIALTANEYNTAKRLKKDYWLYVVFHCATEPSLNILRDPSTLDWQAVTKIEHYRLIQDFFKHPLELKDGSAPYRIGGAA